MRLVWMTTLISLALFSSAVESHADRANAREHVRIGRTLAKAGAVGQALEHYELAIQNDPDYGEAYQLALPLWLSAKQDDKARGALEKLTLRCPTCGFAWYALGTLYRRGERYEHAAMAYEAYLVRRPRDADAVFGLAMALSASGDARALEALQRYVALEDRPERAAYRTEALRRISAFEEALHPTMPAQLKKRVARYLHLLGPLRRIAAAILLVPKRDQGTGD